VSTEGFLIYPEVMKLLFENDKYYHKHKIWNTEGKIIT
jgi:hypothetical protein